MQNYITTISKIESLNDEIKLFRLEFPKGSSFQFSPGQFVMVSVKDSTGEIHKRAYSLASSPSKKYVELCIKIMPDGKVTQILDKLVVGDEIELQGPYGKASLDKTKKHEIILIAAGCGIGAVRSVLYDLFETDYDAPVWLFYGFRYDKDFLFKNDFAHIEEEYTQFHFIPVMSKPGQHSDPDIDVGHVDHIIPQYILDSQNKEAVICGSSLMSKGIIAALQNIGFTKEQIKTDAWG